MKTLTERSTSYQEGRNIDSIRKEQEREFCNKCGKQHPQHPRNKCPAYGSTCLKCGKANHWQSVCRSSKRKQPSQGTRATFKKTIHTIEENFYEDDDEVLTISTIEINAMEGVSNDTRDEAFTTLDR